MSVGFEFNISLKQYSISRQDSEDSKATLSPASSQQTAVRGLGLWGLFGKISLGWMCHVSNIGYCLHYVPGSVERRRLAETE